MWEPHSISLLSHFGCSQELKGRKCRFVAGEYKIRVDENSMNFHSIIRVFWLMLTLTPYNRGTFLWWSSNFSLPSSCPITTLFFIPPETKIFSTLLWLFTHYQNYEGLFLVQSLYCSYWIPICSTLPRSFYKFPAQLLASAVICFSICSKSYDDISSNSNREPSEW